jgi:hypothetical protein
VEVGRFCSGNWMVASSLPNIVLIMLLKTMYMPYITGRRPGLVSRLTVMTPAAIAQALASEAAEPPRARPVAPTRR